MNAVEQLEKEKHRERQKEIVSNITNLLKNKWYVHTFFIEF